MKLRRLLLASSLFFACLLTVAPQLTRAWRVNHFSNNQPPVANNDSYTRHGPGNIGPVLQNDSDPEGNPMTAVLVTTPSHGSLGGIDGNSFSYSPTNPSFVGTDSFTYRACDNQSACSNIATVTINVVNQAPVAVGEFFIARGATVFGPMMANDFDPDPSDQLFYTQVSGASHGTVFGLPNPPFQSDMQSYVPNTNYTGFDSFNRSG